MTVGDDSNAWIKNGCDDGISAMTHNNRLDKTSVSFNFEYTGSTDADLLLEVTVVRQRAYDNWFYSSYNLQIGDGGSTITSAPTASPVAVGETTSAPSSTTTSTSTCVDSPQRFRTRKTDGSVIWRDCSWVAAKSTNLRCSWEGVSSMCPDTCGMCDGTCFDGENRFRVNFNGKRIARDCTWVGNKSTNMRCAADGVSETCRLTCDNC